MGSRSDLPTMEHAANMLRELQVPFEMKVVSAHRTPDWLFEFAEAAESSGFDAIIAGAGGAAHLPGMLASKTTVPVLGVPIDATTLQGMDALLSIVQMPGGVPVATFAVGKPGAINAGLFAAAILARQDDALARRLKARREARRDGVLEARDIESYSGEPGA